MFRSGNEGLAPRDPETPRGPPIAGGGFGQSGTGTAFAHGHRVQRPGGGFGQEPVALVEEFPSRPESAQHLFGELGQGSGHRSVHVEDQGGGSGTFGQLHRYLGVVAESGAAAAKIDRDHEAEQPSRPQIVEVGDGKIPCAVVFLGPVGDAWNQGALPVEQRPG